jgi:hypothetical protein
VSRKDNVLTILAAIFGIGLTAGGACAIGLAVLIYISLQEVSGAVLASILLVPLGGLFLIGGVLLLLRAFRGPRKSRGNS